MSRQHENDVPTTQEHDSTDGEIFTLDSLFRQLGSCGRFQVIFAVMSYSPLLPAVWALMMMVFGAYNPGWTCMDVQLNTSVTTSPVSDLSMSELYQNNSQQIPSSGENVAMQNVNVSKIDQDGVGDQCERMALCQRPRFNAEASTIVTEWNLVCDKSWAPSIVISVQMAGVLVGSYVAGQLGDLLGRKITMYGNISMMCVTNIIAVFSISWQMFATIRFFIGFAAGGILSTTLVYSIEYLPQAWRGFMSTFPFWNLSVGSVALVIWVLKDWRHIHITTAVISALTFLPAVWIPESLRILAVHGKLQKAQKAVDKIARVNRKPVPDTNILTTIALLEKGDRETRPKYSYIHLFHESFRWKTVTMVMIWMFISLIYYGIGFGVKALAGDFYLNFFLFSVTAIPCRLISAYVSTKFGRKYICMLFHVLSSVCCVSVVIVQLMVSEANRGLPTTALAILANVFLEGSWGVIAVLLVEIYPSAVRSLCYGFVGASARLGGIVAPYLIPKEDFPLFVSFIIMALLTALCAVGMTVFPETKGKALPDNFQQRKAPDGVVDLGKNLMPEDKKSMPV